MRVRNSNVEEGGWLRSYMNESGGQDDARSELPQDDEDGALSSDPGESRSNDGEEDSNCAGD